MQKGKRGVILRLRNIKNKTEIVKKEPKVIQNPKENRGRYNSIFNNENPIHLEIGLGKGDFLIGMAKTYPNINFIGIEKSDSILASAIKKHKDIPENVRFINIDAKELAEVFAKEIEVLYLNFSDPWPKNRHAKRRLTSREFLQIYDNIFKKEKTIIQKTDNIILFASSLENLSQYGYTLEKVSLDLHNSDLPNIETEYETKFSNLGYKINYLKAVKKERKDENDPEKSCTRI